MSTVAKAWSPYSALFRDRAIARVALGFRVAEVAREFGVPHETVRRWCLAAGVTTATTYRTHTMPTRNRAVRRVRDGESITAVAKSENLALTVVQQWCAAAQVRSRHGTWAAHKRKPRPGGDQRRATALRAVVEEGATITAAARMVRVSRVTVRLWLKESGYQAQRQVVWVPRTATQVAA